MSLEITLTGVDTTIDETEGLQNLTETPTPDTDADDNDIELSRLPLAFSDRLSVFGDSPFEAALSGYTGGANTGQSVFTVVDDGGGVTDIGFSAHADGTPFKLYDPANPPATVNIPTLGVDSGIDAIDGGSVYLFIDAVDDNIVYGIDEDGDIVFAIYLEEMRDGDGDITGGKIWVAQFEAISNPGAGDDDPDVLDLTSKLFVTASRALDFADLTGAPAGQNLFIAVSASNPLANDQNIGIVVTGRTPANTSDGEKVTQFDTVNTSFAAGPGTFGTSSQMIKDGAGLYLTFVVNPDERYLVPNLTETEANVEENILFDAFFGARGATFDVVQLQAGKSAMVRISAVAEEAGAADATGALYVDELNDGGIHVDIVKVTIEGVRGGKNPVPFKVTAIWDGDSVDIVLEEGANPFDAGAFAYDGGVWTISGVVAGDSIRYETDGLHNRVLIENAGADNRQDTADFDIGNLALIGTNSTTAEIGATVHFEDDGPSGNSQSAPVPLWEDRLPAGNPDNDDEPELTIQTIDLTLLVDAGRDGPAKDFGLKTDTSSLEALGLTSGGLPLAFAVTTVPAGDLLTATANGVAVFTVLVTPLGQATITLLGPLDHAQALPGQPDEDILSIDISALLEAFDQDDDPVTFAADTLELQVEDDAPTIAPSGAEIPTLTTDDTEIPDSAGPVSFAGLFTGLFGADGFKDANDDDVEDADAIAYTLGVGAGASGLFDTLTGEAVLLSLDGTDVVGAVGGATEAFRVSVDAATGAVTLTQSRSVVHDDPTDPEETGASAAKLSAASLITLTATITDGDGDTASASADIGGAFAFEDDGPTVAFGNLVGTGTSTPQVGFWSGAVGADAPGMLSISVDTPFTIVRGDGSGTDTGTATFGPLSFDVVTGVYSGAGALTADFDNDPLTADTSADFTLTVNPDGTYIFDLAESFAPPVIVDTTEAEDLPAGGPDPVQTLNIPDNLNPETSILFFGVDLATTLTPDIGNAIVLGKPDYDEPTLEGLAATSFGGDGTFPWINGDAAANVSSSGIGINDNNLDGDKTSGVTVDDDSIVANPLDLVSTIKVFINDTGGPSLGAGEELYYNVFFADGSSTGHILVDVNDLVNEPGGDAFSYTDPDGKLIDAIQLTMGLGSVKIESLQFTTLEEISADDIFLDFTATLTDEDGDTATSSFAVDLYGRDVGTAYDVTMVDAELAEGALDTEADTFNFDLSNSDASDYLVEGFGAGVDQLALLNAPAPLGETLSTGNLGLGDLLVDDSRLVIPTANGDVTIDVVDATLTVNDYFAFV